MFVVDDLGAMSRFVSERAALKSVTKGQTAVQPTYCDS